MTALNPNKEIEACPVTSARYPLNPISSKPGSNETATDAHHIFPRGKIKGDSWFVRLVPSGEPGLDYPLREIIPHVTGLSHTEHMDVEDHRAWIKYEDGVFNWYDRSFTGIFSENGGGEVWTLLGPLEPQPGASLAKPKKRKHGGEKKRNRVNYAIAIPKDEQENGPEMMEEALHDACEKLYGEQRPPWFPIIDSLRLVALGNIE